MTPNELYKIKAKKTSSCPWGLFSKNHIPEVDDFYFNDDAYEVEPNKLFEERTLEYKQFDSRRYIELSSIWYNDKPVMIIQNAGREGRDHSERFVTDFSTYKDMVSYLKSFEVVDEEDFDVVDPDIDISELTEFYGCKITFDENGQ